MWKNTNRVERIRQLQRSGLITHRATRGSACGSCSASDSVVDSTLVGFNEKKNGTLESSRAAASVCSACVNAP